MSQNIKKWLTCDKDVGIEKFRECAHIYNQAEFIIKYGDFMRKYPKVPNYLDKSIGLEKWARCYSEGDKYDIDTSNSVESMNAVFSGNKEVPSFTNDRCDFGEVF